VRDHVPSHAVREHDRQENKRPQVDHQFKDSIGGDSSNYKEE